MTANQLFLLDPLDTWFFREGRAFGPQESTDVHSVFPPPPLTIQGVLRSRLLADHCGRWMTYRDRCREGGGPCPMESRCDVQSVVGKWGEQGTLVLRGPWLCVDGEAVLPVPADVMAWRSEFERWRTRASSTLQTFILRPAALDGNAANMPGALQPLEPPDDGPDEEFEAVGGWMTWSAWSEYLRGEPPVLRHLDTWWNQDDLWVEERRPGIAIDRELNRHRDHHLYFAHHIRLGADPRGRAVRLAFACSGVPAALFPAASHAAWAIGGEARGAILDEPPAHADLAHPWATMPASILDAITMNNRAKVVLMQPSWFKNGWHPQDWYTDGRTPYGDWTWATALVNRPRATGGWDLAARREKRMRPFVPAGSVFYLTSPSGESAPIHLWDQSISENPSGQTPTLASMGLGHVLVGTW